MVTVFWSTTHARSVIKPQAAPFRLFLRHFQPLATPDAFHSLVVDVPALMTEQRGDAPIAVTVVLAGQVGNRCCHDILGTARHESAALRRSRLFQHPARPSLRDCQRLLHVVNRLTASFRA